MHSSSFDRQRHKFLYSVRKFTLYVIRYGHVCSIRKNLLGYFITAEAINEYLDERAYHVQKKCTEFPAECQRRQAIDTNAQYDGTERVLK